MTPLDLGFPPQFDSFRPAQEEAIEHILTTEKRFVGIGAPPGVGKSAIAYAIAKLLGGRTVILTATLGLQQQYQDQHFPGMVDIRGRSNFACWESGTCEDGGRLGCKDKLGCPYLSAFRRQDAADIVTTSYAYWLAVNEKGTGMRQPDTLILDEAGLAPEWLSRALDFTVSEREIREAGIRMSTAPGDENDVWVELAPRIAAAALARYQTLKAIAVPKFGHARDRHARDLRRAEWLVERGERMSKLDSNWVVTREDGKDEGREWRFECIWPGKYREKLFRFVPRVILMSATLRPKTLGLLGIAQKDCDFREWGRQFPAANGPVLWIPTVRVNSRLTGEGEKRWLDRQREITRLYPDRRGIDHTVSYVRAKQVAEYLRGTGMRHIEVNGAADPDSQNARAAFEKHTSGPADSLLISPSFGTGWDFKYQAAEYQIIAKIPTKDMRSKIMQARREKDPTYEDYLAAQDLVQACGRINRDFDDRGTTYLIDDGWTWFKGKAEQHMPRWYKIRKEEVIPPVLPKIV